VVLPVAIGRCDGRVSRSSTCNRPSRFAPSREAARVPTDDRELAHRFSSGDDESVRAVYERYGRAVHTVAYSIVRDSATAADVVQATFVKAWRAAGTFNPERDLGPWLYTIARRQAIDTLRRERRVEPAEPEMIDVVELPPSLESAWEAWEVRLAVDQLPDDEREVVRLAWFVGLSHPEIADRLAVPVGTVKSRSHRAHRRLASLLAHVVAENRSGSAGVEVDEVARARQASEYERPKGDQR
jgi:RNA polymerase sigma-70 factor (ECF subfamily)